MVLKDRKILDIHLNILAMIETYKKYAKRQNGQMIGKKMIWYYFYNF